MNRYIMVAAIVMMAHPTPAGAQNPPAKPTPVTPSRSSAFLCTESARGGVRFNEESRFWEGASFAAQEKFTARIEFVRQRTVPGKPGERPIVVGADYRASITSPGPELRSERHPCVPLGRDTDLVSVVADNEIMCRALSNDLMLNLRTSRFLLTNRTGFIDGRDVGGNTPSVSIGACTPIAD